MNHVSLDSSTPLSELSAVSRAQLHQLTEEWGQGWSDEPLPTAFLDEILTQQATSQPEAVAIESRGETWTYAELDAVVNAMGGALQSRGVAAGDRVALYAERTMHTIAAALAILRIGGVYVPLDPSYPAERVAYILSDSGARVLAHATEVPTELAQRAESTTVDLSGIAPDIGTSAPTVGSAACGQLGRWRIRPTSSTHPDPRARRRALRCRTEASRTWRHRRCGS